MSMSMSMPALSKNALNVMKKRSYLWPKGNDEYETVDEMFWRVALNTAHAEQHYSNDPSIVGVMANKFFEMMRSLRFIPNTPTLVNAGREKGMLLACFVLPIHDSMEGIMDALKTQALVQKFGGGTGFSFSSIRERGSPIKSTGMTSVGPIPIIKLMNFMMSEFIIQGGTRHGANMGTLSCDAPDIFEFISFKKKDKSCESFNVSVTATDAFMKAVEEDKPWNLVSRYDGHVVKTVMARQIFDEIIMMAWETGDPGMLFIDTANKFNPTPHLGKYAATNPCGEIFLLPNEACTLGHFNLSKYYIQTKDNGSWKKHFDWELFGKDIDTACRFLDDVIDVNFYPIDDIKKMHKDTNRKIGMGIMGLNDLLAKLGVSYFSQEAIDISNEIGSFWEQKSDKASENLGLVRGSFGAFEKSELAGQFKAMRNACRRTIAPTGTSSMIADASPGMEPWTALLLKRLQAGMEMYEVNTVFGEYLNTLEPKTKEGVINYLSDNGTLDGCPHIEEVYQQRFLQAGDIPYEHHIKMQATWQRYVDNAISKTINMKHNASLEDVRNAYMLAWKLGCKGITMYRSGSRENQPLQAATVTHVTVPKPPEEICPECKGNIENSDGCVICRDCGYSVCSF